MSEYIKKEDIKKKYRQSLIDGLTDDERGLDLSVYADVACTRFNEFVDELPTYSFPEREKGEWIEVGDEYVEAYDISGVHTYADKRMCKKCGFIHCFIEGHGLYKFCPNCGADMRGGKE